MCHNPGRNLDWLSYRDIKEHLSPAVVLGMLSTFKCEVPSTRRYIVQAFFATQIEVSNCATGWFIVEPLFK